MHRLVRSLAAAAVCLAGLSPLSASGSPSGDDLGACRAKDQIHIRGDHWTEIKAPKADTENGEGTRKIVDWATPLSARSRIYATNGTVIKVSADAGCTWSKLDNPRELSKLQSAQGKASQDVYTNLATPGNNALWAASYDDAGGVQHPHVYAATFTPQTVGSPEWFDYSTGLPAAGKPVLLAGSAVQASLTYVVVEGPAPDPASGDLQTPARHLYVTYDPTVRGPDPVPPVSLGLTWKELALPAGFSHLEGLTPTLAGRGLWIRSGNTYTMTPDTLADSVQWKPTVTAPGQVTAIDTDFSGNAHVVYTAGQAGAVRDYDPDGKMTERPLPTAGLFVHGTRSGVHAVSGPKGVYGYDTRLKKWLAITPAGVPAFAKMQMPYGRLGRIVIGQAKDTFYRFDTYVGELFAPPPPLPEGIGDFPTLPGDGRTTFTPVKQVVTVTPGQLHDVPVTFGVGPAPNPLDVYFLLDTTGSMQPALDGLKASIGNIAERLHQALGKNACFGLGDFQDFYAGQTQHTYVRDLPITCDKPVEAMKTALGNMPPPAGGSDIPEAQTIALTQAVTGSGQELPDPPVDKHLQAGFRAEAYKVIVLISDSSASQGKQGYPSKAATINTLNVADVKVVSALVSTDEGDHDEARADMEEFAQGTQTLAPPQGVDCDGNHLRNPGDLEGGAPLVCDVGGGGEVNIGPAIVGLLLGVVDPGTLAVDVHDSYRVVQQIKGKTSKIVNLKQSNALSFEMPVRCTQAQDGKDLPVTLVPTVSALPVGLRGEVIVRCRSIPVVPPPPRPVEEPEVFFAHPQHPPVAVAVVQPPIPQAPVSNINPNAGFSNQEEQQFQVAAVGQDASEDDQEQEDLAGELAMSDYRARDAMAAGSALAGAAVLSAAAALAYRRRLQRATSPRTVRF